MYRLIDILQGLRADVLEGEVGLVAHLLEDGAGDADAAGLGQGLEARRDVHAVAVDVLVFDDHVAEVDADAKAEPSILGSLGFVGGHAVLPGGSAGDGIHHAGELDQQAVSHQLDDAAAMPGDERLQNLSAQLGEAPKRAGLVRPHQAGVADHVSRENGR